MGVIKVMSESQGRVHRRTQPRESVSATKYFTMNV